MRRRKTATTTILTSLEFFASLNGQVDATEAIVREIN